MNDLENGLILLLVFLACVLFLFAVYLLWNEVYGDGRNKARERLDQLSANESWKPSDAAKLSLARQKTASSLDRILHELPGGEQAERYLQKAGVSYGLSGAMMRIVTGAAIGALISTFLTDRLGLIAFPLSVTCGALIPILRLRSQRNKRLKKLVSQLPDTLDFFARSLRAGNPFVGALRSAPDEIGQPMARELEITFEEMNYGLDFEEVMENLAERVDAEEMRFFVTSVLVQKTTGGNLAEIMNRIAALLRERIKTRGEVMVQAAEMRVSAHVLIALPFFIAAVLQLLNPGYFLSLFDHPVGRNIVYTQLFLMLLGYLIMRRMTNFRI